MTQLIVDRFGGFEANALVALLIGASPAMLVRVGICVAVIALGTRIASSRMVTYLRLAVMVYLIVTVVNVGQAAYFAFQAASIRPSEARVWAPVAAAWSSVARTALSAKD